MRASLAFLALAALAGTPAQAAAPLLEAQLEAAPGERVNVRGAAFLCRGTDCRTRSSASRPMILCQRLAREAGKLTRFSVDGAPLSAADLEKCNAKAR